MYKPAYSEPVDEPRNREVAAGMASSSYPVLVFMVLPGLLGRQHLATPHTRSP